MKNLLRKVMPTTERLDSQAPLDFFRSWDVCPPPTDA
jgi:hypothetical protein